MSNSLSATSSVEPSCFNCLLDEKYYTTKLPGGAISTGSISWSNGAPRSWRRAWDRPNHFTEIRVWPTALVVQLMVEKCPLTAPPAADYAILPIGATMKNSTITRVNSNSGIVASRVNSPEHPKFAARGQRKMVPGDRRETPHALGKVRHVLKVVKEPLSLETPVGGEDDLGLGDFMENENAVSPVDASIQSDLRDATTRGLTSPSPREERIVRMRFGIG